MTTERQEALDHFAQWREDNAPLWWRDVWIRSRRSRGFISESHQRSGNPGENTVTVALTEPDGRYRFDSERVTYFMDAAKQDLIPGVWYLIDELP